MQKWKKFFGGDVKIALSKMHGNGTVISHSVGDLTSLLLWEPMGQ
jgi:hypothetical protein